MSEASTISPMGRFLANLRELPKTFRESFVRGGAPTTDRTRSSFVFGNVFLHLHAVRTHRWSLRWSTTAGLGIMSVAAFVISMAVEVLIAPLQIHHFGRVSLVGPLATVLFLAPVSALAPVPPRRTFRTSYSSSSIRRGSRERRPYRGAAARGRRAGSGRRAGR